MSSKGPFIILVLTSILGLASCGLFNPEPIPSMQESLPNKFSEFTTDAAPEKRWWETFNDCELNALVEEAFLKNMNLKELWARLKQARARAVQTGADRYPDLTGTAGASHSKKRTKNGSASTSTSEDYSLGLSSSYELDLWGRVRAEQEAAILSAEASKQDLNVAAITLAAEVTNHWLQIIAQRMQKHLLNEQLRINQIYLELIELRFRYAMVSALDVYQQQQVIDQVRAQIPLVEAQESRLMNELSVLLGEAPRSPLVISRPDLPKLSPMPSTGIPADLLENRPDIRAAQLRLQSAGWNVSAARADRLPSLTLSAKAIFEKEHLDLLLDNWLLSIAANLTAPIFDGNRRAAEVDLTMALKDENLAAYRQNILTAIREVEDALVTEAKQQEHILELKQVIQTARKALDQATLRYRNGLTDYLPVLTQLLSVQDLERDLITQQATLLTNRISLYRSLGGTWTKDLILQKVSS
ncbi:MAG: efflux transporter outer membrane subunit [Proteobacteria bacterium]|nr:efflux transporter outer membrane subunit [Pseudomonadota bacterium]MBU4259248.1 efflux transporter outer membrane subunit [Pseudomonadota bacterium]MBU4286749.1 efflux transporter outer membrane subunit [Pseudomonadota bacterium]MBU4414861.1 efflux transporter outer membrane subunit [Pseudomonadota bacterium]